VTVPDAHGVAGGPPAPKRRLRVVGDLPGPNSVLWRAREAAAYAPGFQAIASHAGIAIEAGQGSELVDVDGNRFLDLAGGIGVAALGYGHPTYERDLVAQLRAVHVGSFTTQARVLALEAVTSVTPPGIDRVQLFSGGSEAVESALRLAKAHTGKFEVLSFWGGFHGKTAGALASMGSEFKHGLGPLAPGAYVTPYADCARCAFRAKYPSCGLLCVEFAHDKLKKETTGSLAAILVEPMQGTAGNVIPPPEFLPAVAEVARRHGALLIADEMITGFGRTGRMFAVDHTGVVPDIMTLGKGLGGGYPVSAVAARREITQAEPWSKPSFSSSSYGGNPLASAAVASSVGVVREEGLVEHAKQVGARFKTGLEGLAARHPAVRNVRGKGLFLGFDLEDPEGGRPWEPPRCRELFDALLHRGVISMAYAPRVRLNPPLVLTEAEVDEAIDLFDEALCQVATRRARSA
jgi:4-aminobutyrate aminotransferase-like enzyme